MLGIRPRAIDGYGDDGSCVFCPFHFYCCFTSAPFEGLITCSASHQNLPTQYNEQCTENIRRNRGRSRSATGSLAVGFELVFVVQPYLGWLKWLGCSGRSLVTSIEVKPTISSRSTVLFDHYVHVSVHCQPTNGRLVCLVIQYSQSSTDSWLELSAIWSLHCYE